MTVARLNAHRCFALYISYCGMTVAQWDARRCSALYISYCGMTVAQWDARRCSALYISYCGMTVAQWGRASLFCLVYQLLWHDGGVVGRGVAVLPCISAIVA